MLICISFLNVFVTEAHRDGWALVRLALLVSTHRCCCCRCVRSLWSWAAVNQSPSRPCRRLENSRPEWLEGNYGCVSGSMWAWACQEARCSGSEDACPPARLCNAGSTPCLAPADTATAMIEKEQWRVHGCVQNTEYCPLCIIYTLAAKSSE